MKRTTLSGVVAGTIAAATALLGVSDEAKADHRRPSFGVSFGGGGFSMGYGSGYYGRPAYHGYVPPRRVGFYGSYIAPPSCCHMERVYVPGYWDGCDWHPGYHRIVRVCDHHIH